MKIKRNGLAAALLLAAGALFLAGWTAKGGERLAAVCELGPTQGNQAKGEVRFYQGKGYVLVTARVEGLTPGLHGFHIHEAGDCSSPDASSAKGHFNPANRRHGAPGASMRHAGDLGNLSADARGVADYTRKDRVLRLMGKDSILGRSVIVHANADDFKTQPTGNSGARVACGVIRPAGALIPPASEAGRSK